MIPDTSSVTAREIRDGVAGACGKRCGSHRSRTLYLPFNSREYQRDDSESRECSLRNSAQDLTYRGVRNCAHQEQQNDIRGQDNPEQHKLQHENVRREKYGADQVLLRQIAAGHQHRVSAPAEDGGDFRLVELVTALTALVLDLRANVFGQFGENVVPLFFGKQEFNRVQITIQQFHVISFSLVYEWVFDNAIE